MKRSISRFLDMLDSFVTMNSSSKNMKFLAYFHLNFHCVDKYNLYGVIMAKKKKSHFRSVKYENYKFATEKVDNQNTNIVYCVLVVE